MRPAGPRISVVVPAHDAAATLAEAIDSLVGQTYGEWEAVVVDDGSTDDTAAIAEGYAARDPRIRVVRRAQGGASAARNTGVATAGAAWVLFLDADDWLLPHALERLVGVVGADDRVDAAFGLAARVDATGAPAVSEFGGRDNLFRTVGRTCPFAIHSGIVRRSLVERVGGFDVGLRTCGDWDLWQRVIRSGARIEQIDEVVAAYRLRPRSLSLDARRVLSDGLEVIRRVHAPDPRVPDPAPAYANGLPAADAPAASVGLVGWTAGLALGAGDDPAPLLDLVQPLDGQSVDPVAIASAMCLAAPIARGRGVSVWLELWPELEAPVTAFAAALEERVGRPGLKQRTLLALEQEFLSRAEPTEPVVVGRTYVLALDVAGGVADVSPPDGVERVHCVVRLGGERIGSVETPVSDGAVSGAVLADRIVEEHAWTILGALRDRAGREATPTASGDGSWEFFLQELWGLPWPEGAFYGHRRAEDAQSSRVFDGRSAVTVEVADELPELRGRGRATVLATLAGVPLGFVAVRASRGAVAPQALRAAITSSARLELLRIAVREGVIGHDVESGTPLRARLAAAAGRAEHEPLREAVVLERREPWEIGTSVSRRASLPLAALDDVVAAAETAREPVRSAERPEAVAYDPEALDPDAPGTADAAAPLVARAFRRLTRPETTDRLPILVYHRIADDGPAATARYRLPSAAFAEQLEWLRANGYRTVSIRDWCRAVVARAPLRGRCVALTFDDGYRDFLTAAWPLLRRHRFSATVFLVTDFVGSTNAWGSADGADVELLGWDDVAELERAGVEFGAHSATHQPLTTLTPAEVTREAARSRAALQRRLGRVERLFAYPYGDEDQVVRHLVGAVGFVAGLTIRTGAATLDDSLLALPRIEVAGTDTAESLAAKLWYERERG